MESLIPIDSCLDTGPNAVDSLSHGGQSAQPLDSLVLLGRAREGCRDALDILFEQSRRCILAVIRRRLGKALRAHVESGDILQVTLMRAFQRIEQFEGKSFDNLVAWLAGIAKNAIRDEVDYLRRQRRSVLRTVPLDSEAEAKTGDTLFGIGRLIAQQEVERLERALSCLDAMQRNVVLWRKYEELSFREIGERLGKSPDACRMLLGRALKALGRKLGSKPAAREIRVEGAGDDGRRQ